VTGGSAGLGRATALAFARQGARVGLIARGQHGLRSAADECEAVGGAAWPIACDVADAEALDRAASEFEDRLGPIDIWVNAAMTTVFSPFAAIEPNDFHRVIEVTFLGAVHGTRAALRRMVPRGRGTIVEAGSALAYRSIPLQSAYCAAKHATRAFADAIRVELAEAGSPVWVTSVHLPAMNTPQFLWCKTNLPRQPQPVPPIYQPEVGARAIVWAAHHRRREVWVGSSTVATVLLNKLWPGLLDRYLARHGAESQLLPEPVPLDRPANLYGPVDTDPGVHGPFGDRARTRTWVPWNHVARDRRRAT
jgi:NAD(P)-dependent dehydrogenase (short-subunit alcohol dehydrogenase family)